jgi:hypothetical protein
MSWTRFKKYFYQNRDLGLSLDISRIPFPDDFLATMEPRMQKAFAAMAELERGAIANPDEKRMVGHYWLRSPSSAPTPELRTEILDALTRIEDFAERVHQGSISAPGGKRFTQLLVIGIGGSALGSSTTPIQMASTMCWPPWLANLPKLSLSSSRNPVAQLKPVTASSRPSLHSRPPASTTRNTSSP